MASDPTEELRFDLGLDAHVPDAPRMRARRTSGPRGEISDVAVPAGRRVAPRPRPGGASDALREARELLEATARARAEAALAPPASPVAPSATPPERADDAPFERDQSLTIAAFYERVKRALTREFSDEVWVTGEIRSLRESKGHRYLELADQGAETVGRSAAQALEVACWASSWPPIAAALAGAGVTLEVGRVVRVRGKVSVWEGAGKIRFTLTALDVEALLGGIAAARHRLLQTLAAEGLLEANRAQPLALVPLRIGIVTSPGSEGHRDFQGQLERSGYAFEVRVESSLVQGPEAPAQLAAALGRLAAFEPDLAVLVRGGGARGDLAAFDAEVVARAIASAPFPVWTGVGHTGDRSVADEVSHFAAITPTACGQAVVARVASYWEAVNQRAGMLARLAAARLDTAATRSRGARIVLQTAALHQLDRRSDQLRAARTQASRAAHARVEQEQRGLSARRALIGRAARHATANEFEQVRRRREVLSAFDPSRQLVRGWTLTKDATGRAVRSVGALVEGAVLVTRFVDGDALSQVRELRLSSPGGAPPTLDAMRPDEESR